MPTIAPSITDVSQSDWGCYSFTRTSIERLHKAVSDGRIVWWRRESFRREYANTEPKMHVFTRRTPNEAQKGEWVWHALCDYQHAHLEFIFSLPRFVVTPPKKAQRCRRCEGALAAARKA